MSAKYLKYRDILVAKGSNLYAALEAGKPKLAEKIYKGCEANYRASQGVATPIPQRAHSPPVSRLELPPCNDSTVPSDGTKPQG